MVLLLADIQLAADDRLHARRFRGIHEMHGAEYVAVIGHRDRRHAEFLHPVHKLLDVASAVEHRVVGMQVQMDELGHGYRLYQSKKFRFTAGWRLLRVLRYE